MDASSHHLEAWELGGTTTCLFRPANQATCLVNETAAHLIAELAKGFDETVVATQLAEVSSLPYAAALQLVSALRNQSYVNGLIGRLAAPPGGVGDRWTGNAAHCGKGEYYTLAPERSVTVSIDDPTLCELVAAVLAPLRVANDSHMDTGHRIQATRSGTTFTVSLDGRALVRAADLATARRVILQGALLSLHARQDAAAIMHGSAVAIDGRGVVVAGVTGSGKSTLMLALIAAGARYLADDFTPLTDDGVRVGAFPVAASVKAGSWPLARAWFPAIETAATFNLGPREVRYLDLSAHREPGEGSVPAAAIVFPRYAAGSPVTFTRLAPESVFRQLIEAGSAPAGNPPSMRPIVELAKHVPAWSLAYGDVADAAERVKALSASAPAPS